MKTPTDTAVPAPSVPPFGIEAPTLDDVCMMLVQLEPDDGDARPEWVRLVAEAQRACAWPVFVVSLASDAVRFVEQGSQAGLDEAANLLETAVAVLRREEESRLVRPAAAAVESPVSAPGGAAVPPPSAAPVPAADPAAETAGPGSLEGAADSSLLADFLTESREYVAAAEAALLALEEDPSDDESINTVFRAFHTVKGTSGFLALEPVSQLAHHAESLFDRFRTGELRCTGPLADLSLRAVDLLGALLDAVEHSAAGGALVLPAGYSALMKVLADPDAAGVTQEEASDDAGRLGDLLVAQGRTTRADVEAAAAVQSGRPLGLTLVRNRAATLPDVAQALRAQQQKKKGAEDGSADSSVRVRTDRLDRLVDLVGELVIAQSMIAQDGAVPLAGDAFSRKVGHAGKIVRELQEMSVSMRMVPLKATFQKMARLVRDVARKSGKVVKFEAAGEDTEIDRTMVDVLADPLVHMIRNALDHGLELPEVREAAGKPRSGRVHLSAYHQGGTVVVELQDDGRGLDRERILQKAIARGLVSPDRVVSDSEVFNLIFAPGFSTAAQVTDLSGRGVGMDVVRRNVEALRGRVDIASEAGRGSTFSIRLPLTLAVTDGMLVRVASERYILPTVNIDMSFRPTRESLFTVAGKGEVVLHRDELLPIVRMHRLFGIECAAPDPAEALLVVVGSGERRCALLVDELLGQQQVVAKSLGDGIGKVSGFSGGAILGDGRVGLILDAAEIVALAQAV